MTIGYKDNKTGTHGALDLNNKNIWATFETFNELEEFLNNVELSDGYKIATLIDADGERITIDKSRDGGEEE